MTKEPVQDAVDGGDGLILSAEHDHADSASFPSAVNFTEVEVERDDNPAFPLGELDHLDVAQRREAEGLKIDHVDAEGELEVR